MMLSRRLNGAGITLGRARRLSIPSEQCLYPVMSGLLRLAADMLSESLAFAPDVYARLVHPMPVHALHSGGKCIPDVFPDNFAIVRRLVGMWDVA